MYVVTQMRQILFIYIQSLIKQDETTECGWKIMESITRDIQNKNLRKKNPK